MKKLIFALVFFCGMIAVNQVHASVAWTYSRSITVAPAIAFIASSSCSGNACTTGAKNTTGANLEIIGESCSTGCATPSDNMGNKWVLLDSRKLGGGGFENLWYATSTLTSSTQTFKGSAADYGIEVSAWSGASNNPLDQETGNAVASTTLNSGVITPNYDNELIVSYMGGDTNTNTYTLGSPLTMLHQLPYTTNQAYGQEMDYYLQPTAASVSSTITAASAMDGSKAIASFKPGGAVGTQSNFPMLVSSTLSSWKSAAAGGDIQNVVTAPNGNQEPADLVFANSTSSCASGSYLNFETESYTSSTGALVDWVSVPSESAGTVIYACYDASAVTTDQSHPSSTWNTSYQGVYHFPNGTTLGANDSTANANNGTVTGATAATGKIDGGANFSTSTTQYIQVPSSTAGGVNYTLTAELWEKFNTSNTNFYSYLLGQGEGICGGGQFDMFGVGAGADIKIDDPGGSLTSSGGTPGDGNWHFIVGTETSSSLGIYIDGVSAGSIGGLSNTTSSSNIAIQIGNICSGFNSGTYAWQGGIDEVRYASVVQSPSWILTEYNNQAFPDDSQGGTFYHVGAETALNIVTSSVAIALPDINLVCSE